MEADSLNCSVLGEDSVPGTSEFDLFIKEVNKATKYILDLEMKPLILGGEHSISSGAVSAISKSAVNQ